MSETQCLSKEDILRESILSQYGSILNFSNETKIPYSTIRNIFTRGFDGVGAGTAVQICRYLNLNIDALMEDNFSLLRNPQKEKAWSEYSHFSDEALNIAFAFDKADPKSKDLVRITLAEYLPTVGKKKDTSAG